MAAWVGGLCGRWLPGAAGLAFVVVAVAGVFVLRRRLGVRVLTASGVLLVFAAVLASALLRQQQVAGNPVAELARERAVVTVDVRVTSDPREIPGRYAQRVVLRAEAVR